VQKELRLSRREDFNKVYRRGKSSANHQFILYVLPEPGIERFKLGISVSRKVGTAVVRNRIRRLVKEIVRSHTARIEPHHQLILIARKPAADMDYHQMEKSIIHVLKRASIWKSAGGV